VKTVQKIIKDTMGKTQSFGSVTEINSEASQILNKLLLNTKFLG